MGRQFLFTWIFFFVSSALIGAETRIGTLDNGLQYGIYTDKEAESLSMGLLLRTGTIHEGQDTAGLAPFFIDLNIAGSERLSGMPRLRKSAVSNGSPLAARTEGETLLAEAAFDHTRFELKGLPSSEAALCEGLEIFYHLASGDFLHTLSEEGLTEQWGQFCQACQQDSKWQALAQEEARLQPLLAGSIYAKHFPHAFPKAEEAPSLAQLQHFVKACYKPEWMGLWIQGNIDPDEAEQRLCQFFETLESSKVQMARFCATIPGNHPFVQVLQGTQDEGRFSACRLASPTAPQCTALMTPHVRLLLERLLAFRLKMMNLAADCEDLHVGVHGIGPYQLVSWEGMASEAGSPSTFLKHLLRLMLQYDQLIAQLTEEELEIFLAESQREGLELYPKESQVTVDETWGGLATAFLTQGHFPNSYPEFEGRMEAEELIGVINQVLEAFEGEDPWFLHLVCPGHFEKEDMDTVRYTFGMSEIWPSWDSQ